MCLEIRPKPDGMPEWATELFFDNGNCIYYYHVHTFISISVSYHK